MSVQADYRRGRGDYKLPAAAALAYARDRAVIWSSDLDWWLEVGDCPDAPWLLVVGRENDRGELEVLDALGCDLDASLSDHGNVNTDDREPFLVSLVADMIRGCDAS